jgi:thioredoxin-related protein
VSGNEVKFSYDRKGIPSMIRSKRLLSLLIASAASVSTIDCRFQSSAFAQLPPVQGPRSQFFGSQQQPSQLTQQSQQPQQAQQPPLTPNKPANEVRWHTDLQAAQRAAAQYQVPLLLHFYTDNCLPCTTLEQRVYTQADVITWLNKRFISVRIHGGSERGLCEQYKVAAFPTEVFIAADGTLLYQGVSKQDISSYLEVLQQVAVMNRDRNSILAADRAKQSNPPMQFANGVNGNTTNRFAALSEYQFTPGQPATVTGSSIRGPESVGPLTSNNQPTSISGSVARSQTQIAPANGNTIQDTRTGLPPLPAHLTPPPMGNNALVANSSKMLGAPAGVPFGIAEVQASTVNAANKLVHTSKAATSEATGGIMVSNPFYQNEEPMVCTPDGKCGPASMILAQAPTAAPANPATYQSAGQTPNQNTADSAPTKPLIQQVSTKSSVSEPAALEGYCPVTFVTTGQRVPGVQSFVVRHRGRNYWMRDVQTAQQFLQKPDNFSPVLSGYDPIIFLTDGKLVDGKTEFAMQDPENGTVVLFSSAESRDKFRADPKRSLQALRYVYEAASKP